MTPERWQQIKAIFASALERDPEQRRRFLAEACAGDAALQDEVDGLLAAMEQPDGILDQSPLGAAAESLAATTNDPMAGRHIGPYRLVRLVGRGGMGAVYEAERCDEQYQKTVAIKLVRPEMNVPELLARFRRERQVLANLDHPGIARLLDGGVSEDGLPYLVMEYITGEHIGVYCAARGSSTRARLELFRKVCDAVEYAHQHHIVHRDLKPANILITAQGQPKLLDFGIAKILEGAEARALTLTGQRALTPEYASPEQIRGEEIGPPSDVYSLGVLLYELLTGCHPYCNATQSVAEIERAACELEPAKPSAAAGKELSGDLDNIVLMAMRKEPSRRYTSVDEFSADILRYLEGRPVMARPSTPVYRAAKFLKRRRKESAAAILLIIGTAGGILAGRWFESAGQPARLAIAVLGFKNVGSQGEPWLSTAISEMLTNSLGAGGKLRTIAGEDVALMKRDLALSDASWYGAETLRCIRRYLGADEIVSGSYAVQPATGQVRLDVNLHDAARGRSIRVSETGKQADLPALVNRAGADLRAKLGVAAVSPHEAAAIEAVEPASADALKYYAEGLEKLRQADNPAARDVLEKAIAADPNFPLAHSALAAAWSALGYDAKAQAEAGKAFALSSGLSRPDRLWVEARYRETAHQWDRAIEIYHALWDFFPDNLNYGLHLAHAQVSAGKASDALATIAQLRKLASPDDPRLDLAAADAARSLEDFQGEQTSAANAARKAQAEGAQLLLARARLMQGGALANLGEGQRAEAFLEEARALFGRAGDKAGVASALNNLGNVSYSRGGYAPARSLYQAALDVYRETGDQAHAAFALNNLASVLSDQGDLAGAMKMREASLAITRETGDRMSEATVLANIGNLFYLEGDLATARKQYEESMAIRREIGAVNSGVITLNNLGEVLRDLGELREAQRRYQESAAICRSLNREETLAYALSGLGLVEYDRDELALARKNDEEAIRTLNTLGEKPRAASVRVSLAALSIEESRAAEAEKISRDDAAVLEAAKQNDDAASAYSVLAQALLAQNKIPEAQAALNRAQSFAAQSHDRVVRLGIAIASARIRATAGKHAEAERTLAAALAEATRYRLPCFQLEARLALGEIEVQTGRAAAGRARLARVAQQARRAGFLLIARKAAYLRLPPNRKPPE